MCPWCHLCFTSLLYTVSFRKVCSIRRVFDRIAPDLIRNSVVIWWKYDSNSSHNKKKKREIKSPKPHILGNTSNSNSLNAISSVAGWPNLLLTSKPDAKLDKNKQHSTLVFIFNCRSLGLVDKTLLILSSGCVAFSAAFAHLISFQMKSQGSIKQNILRVGDRVARVKVFTLNWARFE